MTFFNVLSDIKKEDNDDERNVNFSDINNGARAEKDYQIISIGSERAASEFLMTMTIKFLMTMRMVMFSVATPCLVLSLSAHCVAQKYDGDNHNRSIFIVHK